MRNAVQSYRLGFLAGFCALALAALGAAPAMAQSAQAATPPDFAPLPRPTVTITAPPGAPVASVPAPSAPVPSTVPVPAAKPGSQAAVPVPTPKPDPASVSALPMTHVVAGAPATTAGGKILNPYSEQPETKYIKIPVTSTACSAARAAGKPYFVEFRARSALSFGHTFVLFGKLGDGNHFASYKIAGLHPKGDSNNYTMGLWIPVPAETGPSDGDADEQFMTARYCVTLTESEYNRLVPYIKQLQAEHKTWHGTTYNCNSFGMDVAKFVGLDTPNPNASLPKDLIEKLAELNKNRPRNMTAQSGEPGGAQPIRR